MQHKQQKVTLQDYHEESKLFLPFLIYKTSLSKHIALGPQAKHFVHLFLHTSQLIMRLPIPATQIGHAHDLNHETRPPREMLRSLPLACLGVVLLPGKACLYP